MGSIRITRKAKGMFEALAQDDYRKNHPRATAEDLAGVYGASLGEAEELEIQVPESIRGDLAREVAGIIRKARLAYLVDSGAWGDIELAKTGGSWWMWLEYEDAYGERAMIQGAYDLDADKMTVYRAEAA